MKDKEKAQFQRTASNNNGTIRVNLPEAIAKHLNIKPGETIALQTEYSEQYGKYASFWNHTKQEGEQQ